MQPHVPSRQATTCLLLMSLRWYKHVELRSRCDQRHGNECAWVRFWTRVRNGAQPEVSTQKSILAYMLSHWLQRSLHICVSGNARGCSSRRLRPARSALCVHAWNQHRALARIIYVIDDESNKCPESVQGRTRAQGARALRHGLSTVTQLLNQARWPKKANELLMKIFERLNWVGHRV